MQHREHETLKELRDNFLAAAATLATIMLGAMLYMVIK